MRPRYQLPFNPLFLAETEENVVPGKISPVIPFPLKLKFLSAEASPPLSGRFRLQGYGPRHSWISGFSHFGSCTFLPEVKSLSSTGFSEAEHESRSLKFVPQPVYDCSKPGEDMKFVIVCHLGRRYPVFPYSRICYLKISFKFHFFNIL